MKQFIDDPNSLDEGSKAMVCEAVEVLQVSDCKIFSFIWDCNIFSFICRLLA